MTAALGSNPSFFGEASLELGIFSMQDPFGGLGMVEQLGCLLINGSHIPQCLWMKPPRNCEFVISLVKTQDNGIGGNSRPSMHIELDKKFCISHLLICTQRTRWSGRKTETINSWWRQPIELHCGWTIQLGQSTLWPVITLWCGTKSGPSTCRRKYACFYGECALTTYQLHTIPTSDG